MHKFGTPPRSGDFAQALNAKANLLKEERLSQKAEKLHQLGVATEKAELKLPMTSDSLNKLGAGSEYGL